MRTLRWLFAALLAAATPTLAFAQAGTITGAVTSAATGRPLAGAQVVVVGTAIGARSDQNGRFSLTAPVGQHTLRATALQHSSSDRQVSVSGGQTTSVDFSLSAQVVALQELVVSGVSGGGVERGKVPFTVARVSSADMPVAATNPLTQLQGRVPGANIAAVSGRPGVAPQVILRGPTSLNAAGRSQEPLYIVDGVVLGSSIADINPSDIESVEIVKGAAAATLYGSRAASGVISITTKRGRAEGIRFNVRSEYGINDIESEHDIARNHTLLLDETGKRFCVLDPAASSNVCSRTIDWSAEQARINEAPGDFALSTFSFPIDPNSGASGPVLQRTFMASQWPGRQYNAVAQLVDPKPLLQNNFDMSGRAGSTSFFASVGQTKQGGAIAGLSGYERYNGRINVNHLVGDTWSFDLQTYLARSEQDGSNQEEGGTGFFRLTRVPGIADITLRDQLGRLYIRPNLLSGGVQNENPLYSFENTERMDERHRYIASGTVRFTPVEWVDADATFNIDRLNTNFEQFNNRGFRTTNLNPATNEGLIFNGVNNTQSINTSTGLLLRPLLADWVDNTFSFRWLFEEQKFDGRTLQGNRLRVADVTDARNATVMQTITATDQLTRQMSFSAGTFLDVLDRYTFDFAVRRDGNSRFGADERWATYGRASAAWLMAEESWFPSDILSTFTLRSSFGSAGNAPSFNAQYETYTIGAGGTLTAVTLGNPGLVPEVVTEMEFGGDLQLLDRVDFSLTYANSLAKNQILPVPVAVSTGFPTQWQNAGSLRNRTWEASLTVPFIDDDDFSWSSSVNFTRNRAHIERLDVPEFYIGTDLQATGAVIKVAQGERFGTLYGVEFMTKCSQLPATHAASCGGPTSAFQVNDDGYLVWVGEGNNPGMGITDNLWSAILPAAQAPYGIQAAWGLPILIREPNGTPQNRPLGNALPDFRAGWSNTIGYKNFSLYGLVEGVFGRSVWNQARHWAQLDFLAGHLDQGKKSVEDAKPIAYYYRRGPGGPGGSIGLGGFYDVLTSPNNEMVEDASFIKLREISLGYDVGPIAGVGDWSVNLIGRNLRTWTEYSGFDPEVGVGVSTGSQAGSGLINAIDAFSFPQLRTLSIVVNTTF